MVGVGKPSGGALGIVLVGGAVLASEAPAPHTGVDLGDGGPPGRNIQPVQGQGTNARRLSASGAAEPKPSIFVDPVDMAVRLIEQAACMRQARASRP